MNHDKPFMKPELSKAQQEIKCRSCKMLSPHRQPRQSFLETCAHFKV